MDTIQYNVLRSTLPYNCAMGYTKGSNLINWHQYYEFIFSVKGSADILCHDTYYTIHPGDIIAINPNSFHNTNSASGISAYYLTISPEFFRQNGFEEPLPLFQNFIQDPELFKLFQAIPRAFHSEQRWNKALTNFAVLQFVLYLCQNYSVSHVDDNIKNTKKIARIIDYINQNIHQQISLDDISLHIGLSKYHLCREFKRYTNHSILEYINMVRCHNAHQLICAGSTVSAAALSCGFTNLSHFSKIYKRYIGHLPTETIHGNDMSGKSQ